MYRVLPADGSERLGEEMQRFDNSNILNLLTYSDSCVQLYYICRTLERGFVDGGNP